MEGTLRLKCLVGDIFEIEFLSKSFILIEFQSVLMILAHETYKMELQSTKRTKIQLNTLSTKRTKRL